MPIVMFDTYSSVVMTPEPFVVYWPTYWADVLVVVSTVVFGKCAAVYALDTSTTVTSSIFPAKLLSARNSRFDPVDAVIYWINVPLAFSAVPAPSATLGVIVPAVTSLRVKRTR